MLLIFKHIDKNCDGRNNKNILEDIYEAFIGALYLDTGDIKLIELFIISVIEKYVDFSDTIMNDTNYKDQLLKYFQHNYKCNPIYKTEKINDKQFRCTISSDINNENIATYIEFNKKKGRTISSKSCSY